MSSKLYKAYEMSSYTTAIVCVIALVALLSYLIYCNVTSNQENFGFYVGQTAGVPQYGNAWPNYWYQPAVRAWQTRWPIRGGRRHAARWRPYRNWANYIAPSYYPAGYYPYSLQEYYDPYDYSNIPEGEICFARISITDAFGPYTAGVMGKQAWLDWAGRNGFQRLWLPRESVTNDHCLVEFVGVCPTSQQQPPSLKRYSRHNATPNYF